MKKYICQAFKKQLEKPTEPKYIFNAKAKVNVFAENDEEALKLAAEALEANYYGTGVVLGKAEIVASYDLPIDGCLVGNNVIR